MPNQPKPLLQGNGDRIGRVTLKRLSADVQQGRMYSDGEGEDRLFEFFASTQREEPLSNCYRRYPVWECHLSPVRHNLLKWYPFDSSGSLLDVGAGCGALTRLFTSRVAQVTALEFSPQRARILAFRHQNCTNLEVLVGRLQDLQTDKRFRYINITGVLEYAGTFFGGPNPYLSFLERAASFLEPGGELILAIENKLGLKYLTGAPEDHTGLVFESIYDYPRTKSARTFSRKELAALLSAAGLGFQEWYYPFPDYKFPQTVCSDDALPDSFDRIWGLCPVQPLGTSRREVIKERLLGKTLASAGLFREFANSFLIVGRKSRPSGDRPKCLRFWAASPNRRPEFRLDVTISRQPAGTYFVKTPSQKEAETFIEVVKHREEMACSFFSGKISVVRGEVKDRGLQYPLLPHPSIEKVIGDQLRRGDEQAALPIIKGYISLLQSLRTNSCVPEEFLRFVGSLAGRMKEKVLCFSAGPIDLIPSNILVQGGSYYVVDNEWFFEFPVPFDFVVYRGVASLVFNLQDDIRANAGLSSITLFSGHLAKRECIPMVWVDLLRGLKLPLGTLHGWNSAFQKQVLLRSPGYGLRLSRNPRGSNRSGGFTDRAAESADWHLRRWRFKGGTVASKLRDLLQDLRGKLHQPD